MQIKTKDNYFEIVDGPKVLAECGTFEEARVMLYTLETGCWKNVPDLVNGGVSMFGDYDNTFEFRELNK